MELPNMKRPCANCPFRKVSPKGWLGQERMTGILEEDSFTCHKTLGGGQGKRRQCAGHMLLSGRDNQFVRLAIAMGLDTGLSGRELVFDTKQECIEHHSKKKFSTTDESQGEIQCRQN